MKWVSLLLWAGASPRSLGPNIGKEYTKDPESFTNGLLAVLSSISSVGTTFIFLSTAA